MDLRVWAGLACRLLYAFWICGGGVTAFAQVSTLPLGHHDGYLGSVEEERHLRIHELVMFDPPPPERGIWRDIFYDPRLNREFITKYEREFGYTDAERNIDASHRFEMLEYNSGVRVITVDEDVERKRVFGEFMIRRLSETQVDNFFKSNESVRGVYEVKERVSNVDVKVKKGYKFGYNYSLSGNHMHLRMDTPFQLTNRVTLQMDPAGFGPSKPLETLVYLRYPVAPKVTLSSYYKVKDGVLTLVGAKKLSTALTASITGSTYMHEHGTTVRQHRIILGLTWVN